MRAILLFLILSAVQVFGQVGDITAKSLGALGGSTDDTTAIQRGITNASARGVALDLQGGTYKVTALTIDRTVTIKNGTLKAYAAQTNSWGLVTVTNGGTGVIFDGVTFHGNSLAMRTMRIYPGTSGRFKDCTIGFASGPSGLDAQTCALMINGESVWTSDNLNITNAVGVANGVVGDNAGAVRGIVVITSASEGPPDLVFNNTKVGKIYSTGSSDHEDADGISVHRFGDGLAHIVFRNTTGYDTRKRLFKIMTDGVMIDGFEMVYSDTCTNMLEIVGGYAGNLTVRGGKIPAMGSSYGIGIVNNQSAMGNVIVEGNQVFNGTNDVMSATSEGIRVGGSYGTTNVIVANNTIGTSWGKPLLGIHIAGGVTNYNVVGNTIWAGESGVYDGWRYSGEQTWGTNRFGSYVANSIAGNPSGEGMRFKKTSDLSVGLNAINAVIPFTFDNGTVLTTSAGNQWNQNIIGGSATNFNAIHIGDSASTTWNAEVPDFQIASSIGTNAIAMVRFWDGTTNRVLAIRASYEGISLDTSYTTGGNGTFTIRQAGTPVFTLDSSGVLHLGDSSAATVRQFFAGIPDDATGDDLALTNALAAVNDITFKKGTYNFSTNIVIGPTKRIKLESGAILKPASGIIIEFTGELDGPKAQCIDESAGGRVIFSIDTRTREASSLWWGADNTGNADATSALRKWAYCGVAGAQITHYLDKGAGYLVTGEIVLSNRVVVTGSGSSGSGGSTILSRPGANEAVFALAPGANSVQISKILFSASSTAGTNSSAIRLGNSSNNHTWIYDCAFQGFRGFAIYSAGNSLYTEIYKNRFFDCRNTAATSGNGLRPSGAVFSTNVFSASTLWGNKVSTCDMAYLFDGGATTNSGNIAILYDSIEGNGGIGGMDTNLIAGYGLSELSLTGLHVEHNTNHNLVYLSTSKMFNAKDGLFSGDYGGTVMATNGFFFDLVETMNISSRLSHFESNYVFNTSATIPARMTGSRFDVGSTAISDLDATAYMTGAYIMNDLAVNRFSTYAAGTAYSFTATPALLDFGTTDPSITIAASGTYMIFANVGLKYNGATYAGNQTATIKLRRTNNTAADLTSGSRVVTLGVVTTLTSSLETAQLPPVYYVATAGDIISIFGSVSATPAAGSVDTDSAEIIAVRIQ